MTRAEKLRPWLTQAMVDHPEVIKDSEVAAEVYCELQQIWLEDVQVAMKELALEIMPELKKDKYK